VVFLGHDFGGWWIGTQLDVHTTKNLCKDMTNLLGFVGPTALQVGASLAAAVCWGIMNPKAGANLPEHLPSDLVVSMARPWLGNFVSVRHDWKPTEVPRVVVTETSSSSDTEDESESDSDSPSDELNNPRSRVASESPTRAYGNVDEWQFCNFVTCGCDFVS